MRGKKKVLVGLLATLMLSSVAVGMTGCKPDNPDNSSTSEVQGLTGNYYCSAAESDYTLSLDGARFELKLAGVTLSGAYTFEGETLVLLAEAAEGVTEIEAKAKDGVITFKYDNVSYTFYENVSYTVTFESNGGTAIEASKVVNGKTLSKPADPVKANYRFIGWYVDADFKTPFAFDSDVVTSDMTLYARYVAYSSEAAEYTVTLVVDGEEVGSVETVNGVAYGLPTPAGDKAFAGWWVSDSQDAEKLTYKYVDQVLTQDVKLFAVWADGIQASVNASGVTWAALATGVEYTVKVEDAEGNVLESRKTTALSLEYDFSAEAAGEYKVTVSANGKTATLYYMNKALSRVSIFEVQDGNMLVFNAVENAQKYLITVECGNAAHQHADLDNGNSTNYNFANCAMPEDGIKFVVKAVADGYVTSVSETFVYNRKLAAVANVAFNAENGDLTWDAVENATSYNVEITANGVTDMYSVATNAMSMKAYSGEVSVKVTAIAANYNSEPATEYSYTCNKLVAPVATLVGDELSWNAVAGASSYAVVINGTSYTANGTTFAIPAEYKTKGNALKITVQAVAAEAANSSYASDEMTVNYGVVESVSYADGALTWDLVGGAYSYKVQVNGGVAKDASQGMALSYTKAGDNTVTLSAYNSDGALLSRKDITVKAYEVSFNAQGGAAVGSLYLATGDAIELPASSKPGYSFQGWYVSAGDNAAKYENVVFEGEEDTTLYAYWESNKYEVTLMVGKLVKDEATGKYVTVYEEFAKEYVPYGKSYNLSVPELTSKAFVGWYEDDNLSSRQFTDKDGNSVAAWSRLGGHKLYAGTIDIFKYSVQEDADGKYYEVVATEEAKDMTEITVPSYYVDPMTGEGLPVWGIATGAFAGFSNLRTLNLPDNLKYIYLSFGGPSADGSALDDCYSLKNINVYCEDGEHGEHADHPTYFSSENGLLMRHASPNTDTLDNGKELYFVPYNRSGVLEIPVGVEHLTQRVLSYMSSSVTQVIVPHTVKYIGDSVFRGSYAQSIIFAEAPEGEEEVALKISDYTFAALSYLTELVLPTRMGIIDFNATRMFEGTQLLKDIKIVGRPTAEDAAAGTYYKDIDGVVVSYDKAELVYFPQSRTGEYTIPVEIETIGTHAFLNTKISKVIIKDNVYSIEKEAFLATGQWISGLEAVEFAYEKGELEIGEKAFYGCKKLQELVLPVQLTKLGANAFGDTEELQTVTLNSASDAEFAANVFANDDGEGFVTTLNIGANVPTFEINSVFYGCRLFSFNIDATNGNFKQDAQGVVYDAEQTAILYYPYGLATEYVIPASVETIGAGVFENRANITTMNIPATVKTIKAGAFKNCGIETLTFSARTDDLTIEANAFENCVALESVALPENMTSLANNAFKGCSNLANVSIPKTLTNMTFGNAFAGCDYLASVSVAEGNTAFTAVNGILYKAVDSAATELLFVPGGYEGDVVVPSTVTTIGANIFKGSRGVTGFSFENNTAPTDLVLGASLFENAKGLKTVRLPDGLQQIPQKMLMGSSVQYVYVPSSVVKVNTQAFANCEKLTQIEFAEGDLQLEFAAATSETTSAFSGTKKLTSLKLPARTKAITNYMFAGSYLTNLELPATLTSMGNYAFYKSTGLTRFVMPDTITSIGTYTFTGCENLTEVVLSKNLTTIPQYAFGEKPASSGRFGSSPAVPASGITSIVIPASVTKIDTYAFHNCANLTSVTFEDGSQVSNIGNYAFTMSGITSFDMPDSVTTVGTHVFAGCVNLTDITLSNNITTITKNMFGKQDASSSFLGSTPGYEAAGITSIHIPASVTKIDANAFRYCTALKTVTFDENCQLTNIGNLAFEGSGITKITLPENITGTTTFGTTIFKNCVDLKEAYLPKSIAGLNNCFLGCALEVLEVATSGDASADAFYVDTVNGFVMNGDKNAIQLYFGTAEEVVIPAGVVDIANNAFAGNTSLKKITLPSTLQKIGNEAFMGCSNLAEVVAPQNIALNNIGTSAFKNSGLTSIIVPYATVGASAFEGCENLTSAVLFNTNMSKNMFKGCTSLSSVTFMADTVAFAGYTFQNCTSLKSFTWPKNIASIGQSEFAGSGLESIVLPASLNNVLTNASNGAASSGGGAMFEGCANLTSVTIEEGITKIPNNMFVESGLTSVTFPKSLVTLGNSAFRDCWSLAEVNFHPEQTSMTWYGSTFSECPLVEVDLSHMTGLNLVHDATYGYFFAGDSASKPNTTLKTVILPDHITTMPIYMFRYCAALETVVAPGVTAINKYAFNGCSSLANLEIDYANMTAISEGAFNGCASLTSFKVADTVTSIDKQAFYKAGLTSIDLGKGVTTIADQAFYGTALKNVLLPAQVETIGAQAFGDCASLVYFNVESGSNFSIGDYGELYNSFNQLVVFPMAAAPADGKVTLKGGSSLLPTHAFYGNTNVTEVVLSSATTEIPANTFANSSISSIVINAGVTKIGDSAFSGCLALTAVVLPNSVTSVGASVFNGCTALADVTLPKNLATIGKSMFSGCTALKAITLPANVTTIDEGAFANSGLTAIEFPAKLTTIKDTAFKNTKLTSVVIPATVTVLGTQSTSSGIGGIGIGSIVLPGVGGGSIGGLIIGGPSTTGGVFEGCTELTSVVFEGLLDFCGKAMFKGCTKLESVTFAEGWDTIEEGMFSGCTALNLEIPASVETIEKDAFADWTAEQTITINVSLAEAKDMWGEGWNGNAKVVVKA